jgi:hypothetical protein
MFYARWMRKGVLAATSFIDRLQPYVAEWASCDIPPRKISYYRLKTNPLWSLSNSKVSSCR